MTQIPYDDDILAWSERQAEALRRRSANELDWDNIAEEIESVGRNEFHAVELLLLQALCHMLKAMAWPQCRDARKWQKEASVFRRQARRRFAPSMRQRFEISEIWADALDLLPETVDGQPPGPLPATCPWTLDDLLEGGTARATGAM